MVVATSNILNSKSENNLLSKAISMAFANFFFLSGSKITIDTEPKTELFIALFKLTKNALDETVINAYQVLIKMVLGDKDLAKNVNI